LQRSLQIANLIIQKPHNLTTTGNQAFLVSRFPLWNTTIPECNIDTVTDCF